ncbi:unnamed protein product, partial [Didymodactylos carnosus]
MQSYVIPQQVIKSIMKQRYISCNEYRWNTGPCELSRLKYFKNGPSFGIDDRHTVYRGVMHRLLTLWLSPTYTRCPKSPGK